MSIMQQISAGTPAPAWEAWDCRAEDCREGRLHVARHAQGLALWLVRERPGWVIGAAAPVCPACGGSLHRAPAQAPAVPTHAGAALVR